MTVLVRSLVVVSILLVTNVLTVAQSPRVVPDYGVMLNEDGDVVFTHSLDADPAVVAVKLRENLDSLLDTPVRTLVFNVACGSDILHYPTRVGSTWGWRETEKEKSPPWNAWMPRLRAAAEAGLDSVRIAGDWAQERGLLFVPSFRINDAHYTGDPMNNTLTGRFWVEHGEKYELGVSPLPEVDNYKHLLDFSHAEARDFRLAVMREVIERYGDVMDGLQIDFTRHPYLFPREHVEARAPLLTEMVAQVRAALDAAGRAHGKDLPLMVRVPPTVRNCRWAGIEIERWVAEGLIDVVLPSASMTLSHDSLDEFAALARPHGVRVGGAVFPRAQYAWPVSPDATADDFTGDTGRDSSAAQLRGAAAGMLASGATIIELYNFNLPLNADGRAALDAVAHPMRGDRVYAVTPAYYLDHTDTYENRKQIPADLRAGEPTTLNLTIGETEVASTTRCVLRLGFHGVSPDALLGLNVTLNDAELFTGSLGGSLIPVTGRATGPTRQHPSPATTYLQVAIESPDAVLRQGTNVLRLTLTANDARAMAQLVEAQLAVFAGDDAPR